MLERPIGSVRWKEGTSDRSIIDVTSIASPGLVPEAFSHRPRIERCGGGSDGKEHPNR